MVKFDKGFFNDNEVLFVGYSSRNKAYSNGILQAFTNNNIKVYPYNTKDNTTFDTKVYKKLEELPVMPKSAYILLNKANTTKAVKQLIDNGFTKILFYHKSTVDPVILSECDKAGVEVAIGCPLMIYGTGIHKIHAFFAGVK
ncbi:MAG: CoA-binding protein [Herbinix sp.]|nr:CoA-binding protein [Herbinix sp.]